MLVPSMRFSMYLALIGVQDKAIFGGEVASGVLQANSVFFFLII